MAGEHRRPVVVDAVEQVERDPLSELEAARDELRRLDEAAILHDLDERLVDRDQLVADERRVGVDALRQGAGAAGVAQRGGGLASDLLDLAHAVAEAGAAP